MRPSNLAKQNLLIISNKEAKDIMKIVKSIKKSGLMWKGVSKIICNEAKEQKVLSIRMLLGTQAATLLVSMLPGKGVIRTCEGQGKIRAGQGFECRFILWLIWKYGSYQSEPKFNGVYSRNS